MMCSIVEGANADATPRAIISTVEGAKFRGGLSSVQWRVVTNTEVLHGDFVNFDQHLDIYSIVINCFGLFL